MAVIRAGANGNWSNTSTWIGGVVPSFGDTVYANGFTVTIDQNIDLTGSVVDNVTAQIIGQIYMIVATGTTSFTGTANFIQPGTNAAAAVAGVTSVGAVHQAVSAAATGTGTVRRMGALVNYINALVSAAAGGSFVMGGNFNITGAHIQAGGTNCLTYAGSISSTLDACRVVGSATQTSVRSVFFDSTNTLTVNNTVVIGGRATASSVATSPTAIENNTTGTIALTGGSTVNGGVAVWSLGINNNVAGTITATACTITSGTQSNAFGVYNNSNGVITVTSSVISGGDQGAAAIRNAANGSVSITSSTLNGGNNNASALFNTSTGTVTITSCTLSGSGSTNGTCVTNTSTGSLAISDSTIVGGTGSAAICITNSSTGIVSAYNCTITGGNGAGSHGINNTSTGTVISTGDITASNGSHGIQSTNSSALVRVSGSLTGAVNGFAAVNSSRYLIDPLPANARYRQGRDGISTYTDFFTADNGFGQAPTADVRAGTVYASGLLTGTLAVPAAGSVALGVAVDNTVGTAVLTPSAVWNALTSGMTVSGSIGERLKNCASVDSTGAQIAAAVTPP